MTGTAIFQPSKASIPNQTAGEPHGSNQTHLTDATSEPQRAAARAEPVRDLAYRGRLIYEPAVRISIVRRYNMNSKPLILLAAITILTACSREPSIQVTGAAGRDIHDPSAQIIQEQYVVQFTIKNLSHQDLVFDHTEETWSFSSAASGLTQTRLSKNGWVIKPNEKHTFIAGTDGYTLQLHDAAKGSPVTFAVTLFNNKQKILPPYTAVLPKLTTLPKTDMNLLEARADPINSSIDISKLPTPNLQPITFAQGQPSQLSQPSPDTTSRETKETEVSLKKDTMKGREAEASNKLMTLRVRGLYQQMFSQDWYMGITVKPLTNVTISKITYSSFTGKGIRLPDQQNTFHPPAGQLTQLVEREINAPFIHPAASMSITIYDEHGEVLSKFAITHIVDHMIGVGILPASSRELYENAQK